MDELEEAKRLVLEFFEGDEKKRDLWFESPNPLLGNIAPDFMITLGKTDRLLKFIRDLIDGGCVG